MSSQDTAAPKRRSAAANRRRKRRSDVQANLASPTPSVVDDAVEAPDATTASPTRAERKASARPAPEVVEASAVPAGKHLRRQQERREAKAKRTEKKSGVGRLVNTERFSGIQGFSRATMAEIKKVNWPDREATRNLTILVIALSTILGLMLGGIDYVLFQIFEAMS